MGIDTAFRKLFGRTYFPVELVSFLVFFHAWAHRNVSLMILFRGRNHLVGFATSL